MWSQTWFHLYVYCLSTDKDLSTIKSASELRLQTNGLQWCIIQWCITSVGNQGLVYFHRQEGSCVVINKATQVFDESSTVESFVLLHFVSILNFRRMIFTN